MQNTATSSTTPTKNLVLLSYIFACLFDDKSNAISLSGFYPSIKASFNCQAQGLSRVEKSICNSAEAMSEDKV